jgi:UDP-N-acetylglucosamine:LPS N-acetylglucosamine transferase
MESKKIIKEFKPDVLSEPVVCQRTVIKSQHDGIPTVIQEQNSILILRINY